MSDIAELWNEIETAPKDGTVVQLKCDGHPEYGMQTMFWSRGRWEGREFAIAASVRTVWDTKRYDPPSHWRPTTPPPAAEQE